MGNFNNSESGKKTGVITEVRGYRKCVSLSLRVMLLCAALVSGILPRYGNYALSGSGVVLSDDYEGFELQKVTSRIFTPDEPDSDINRVRFHFVNNNFSEVSARIFNIEGREVAKNLPRETEYIIYWDGRDLRGRVAPMGVYIYSIAADGKTVTGIVGIAK